MSYKPQRIFLGSEGEYSIDDKGPEALKQDLDNIMGMFDPTSIHPDGSQGGIDFDNLAFNFADSGMAEKLGATLDGNVLTIQQIINTLYQMSKDRYTKTESDNILINKTNPLIRSLLYNTATGVLDAVTEGGDTIRVFDLNIEKIPAAIGIVEEDGKIYIRVTNDDGTYTQSDVSELLTQFSFESTETVGTTTLYYPDNPTHKFVSFYVKDASLEMKHFAPGVLSSVIDAKESSAISAAAALQSEKNAKNSADQASESENEARRSELSAANSANTAAKSEEIAVAAAKNAAQLNETVQAAASQVASDKETAQNAANTASIKATAAENAFLDAQKEKEQAKSHAEAALSSKNAAASSASAAATSASTATAKADNASTSANSAKSSADNAKKSQDSALNYSKVAKQNSDNADSYSKLSQSYAVGDTGKRTNEDTDNAKYYCEKAKANAAAGSLTFFVQPTEPATDNCIWAKVIKEV